MSDQRREEADPAMTSLMRVLEVGGTHVTAATVDTARQQVLERTRHDLDSAAAASTILDALRAAAMTLADTIPSRWAVAMPDPFDYHGASRCSATSASSMPSTASTSDARSSTRSRPRRDRSPSPTTPRRSCSASGCAAPRRARSGAPRSPSGPGSDRPSSTKAGRCASARACRPAGASTGCSRRPSARGRRLASRHPRPLCGTIRRRPRRARDRSTRPRRRRHGCRRPRRGLHRARTSPRARDARVRARRARRRRLGGAVVGSVGGTAVGRLARRRRLQRRNPTSPARGGRGRDRCGASCARDAIARSRRRLGRAPPAP